MAWERGMKKKTAHFALTWLLDKLQEHKAPRGGLLRGVGETGAEQNLCSWKIPIGKTLVAPLTSCPCGRGQGTLRTPAPHISPHCPSPRLTSHSTGDLSYLLSHKTFLGCPEKSRQPLLFLSLCLGWFPLDLLVWWSMSSISAPGLPKEKKKVSYISLLE